jgi:cytochrome d ubiquinol oxidase subunit I
LLAGVSAYQWLHAQKQGNVVGQGVLAAFKTGTYIAALLIPLQILVGDLHGLNTLQHQPAKLAAMEGIWETEQGADLRLFAIPDAQERRNHWEITLPNMASFILTHDWNGEIKGLNEFKGEHPPVAPVFWGFRIMVGVGMLMLLSSWLSAWQCWRSGMARPAMVRFMYAMSFSGWVATLAGWYVTEIGRQPWLVHGVLATSEAASNVPAPMIGISLTIYLALYVVLIASFISVLFYLARQVNNSQPVPGASGRAVPSTALAAPEVQ